MGMLIRLVLLATYPLLLLARVLDAVRGHDRLRRTNPRGSMWIERGDPPPAHSYFSASPPAASSWSARVLAGVAALVGRKTAAPRQAARPDDIPDEVYTLW